MKYFIPKIKCFLLVFAVVLTASCSPEDGADGVQGPAGPAGQDGIDGVDGIDGNANVISVVLEDVALVFGSNEISIAELTADIASNGFVQGYIADQTANQWYTLPLADYKPVEALIFDEGGNQTGTEIAAASAILLHIEAVGSGKVILYSLFEGTVDLRFALVEASTP
ncbi:hypothetical protein [Flavisericum labens]|uniref:hypothetical protein n=1 Tax=Flavisericum labens TaxID=3377112 RepID=UPI00387B91D3